jgi:hypothetical protein
LGAVLALSIALLSLNLYEKVTNSDDPKEEDADYRRQKEAAKKRMVDKDSPSPSVWNRFVHHPRRLTIMILAGWVVVIVWRAKDYSPPDDLK